MLALFPFYRQKISGFGLPDSAQKRQKVVYYWEEEKSAFHACSERRKAAGICPACELMIYFNNAATSWPKFPSTVKTMSDALAEGQLYCGRDSADFLDTEKEIFELRERIGKDFLHAESPYEICFSSSSTVALNNLILGNIRYWERTAQLPENGLILCSDREHNSVMRPLVQVEKQYGIGYACVKAEDGIVSKKELKDVIKKAQQEHREILFGIFSQVNNVTGDVLNTKKVGKILHKNGIPFLVDATQGIGITPIDVEECYIDGLAFAGHKGLNGPQGTGGFYIRKDSSFKISPISYGGTGHESMRIDPPVVYPDSFEVGTPPVHDLLGLADSTKKILETPDYADRILGITQYAHGKLAKIQECTVFGTERKLSPILSFRLEGISPSRTAEYLWEKAEINCRCGVLCSPMGVKAIGQDSVVRFSFGYYNTKPEVDKAIETIQSLLHD